MEKLRLTLAITVCKLLIMISRLLGKKGSSVPGQIALKICPGVLSHLSKQVRGKTVFVCGTNGKTTTNNLLYSLFLSEGKKVVCNNVGANMLYGVCCAYIEKSDLFGKLDADFAALEVDEASAVKVVPQVKPDIMVITNLFRDQLDRYGEIDNTLNYIKRALELSPETKLLLNGDDPLLVQFGLSPNRKAWYMCVDENVGISVNEVREGQFCSLCGSKLIYDYYHYSQLGKFSCPSCGFKRPEPDFKIDNVKLGEGISFTMDYFGKSKTFDVPYRGFYNIYNIALSYSAAYLALGNDIENSDKVFSDYKPQTGRMEEFTLGNKKIILNLSKNPAGFNQSIAAVGKDMRKKDVLVAINDNAGDGKDVSWLWDVDFERLKSVDAEKIVISGERALDLAVRLKYAGISEEKIIIASDLKDAAKMLVDSKNEVCYALVNYTVVFKMQEIFKEIEKKYGR